jgi:hypothetical protein
VNIATSRPSADPKSTCGETSNDWPHVVAVSGDGKYRIVVSNDTPPTMQWILQRRFPSQWQNLRFCQSKIGLRIVTRFDPALKALVENLPDWCPQTRYGKAERVRTGYSPENQGTPYHSASVPSSAASGSVGVKATQQRVFQVIDNPAEVDRLHAEFPDALIIHCAIVKPPASALTATDAAR